MSTRRVDHLSSRRKRSSFRRYRPRCPRFFRVHDPRSFTPKLTREASDGDPSGLPMKGNNKDKRGRSFTGSSDPRSSYGRDHVLIITWSRVLGLLRTRHNVCKLPKRVNWECRCRTPSMKIIRMKFLRL